MDIQRGVAREVAVRKVVARNATVREMSHTSRSSRRCLCRPWPCGRCSWRPWSRRRYLRAPRSYGRCLRVPYPYTRCSHTLLAVREVLLRDACRGWLGGAPSGRDHAGGDCERRPRSARSTHASPRPVYPAASTAPSRGHSRRFGRKTGRLSDVEGHWDHMDTDAAAVATKRWVRRPSPGRNKAWRLIQMARSPLRLELAASIVYLRNPNLLDTA